VALSIRDYSQTFYANASTIVFTIPATIQAGDVMVIQLVSRYAINMPLGWTSEYSSGAGSITARVMSKVATGKDSGASFIIEFGFPSPCVVDFIAVAGSYGLRALQGHMIANPGGPGTPSAIGGVAGDMSLYLGGTRFNGGAPTISRGTVDISGYDGTVYAGTVGHELLAVDDGAITCTFTPPLSTNGSTYSVLAVSSTPLSATSRLSRLSVEVLSAGPSAAQMSRLSVEVLSAGPSAAQMSRMSVEVLVPTKSRYRGWGPQR
jgi:hypothetical protein